MYTDVILEEKYRIQKEIAKENNYNLKKMAEEASKKVKELSQLLKIKIKYSDVNHHDRNLQPARWGQSVMMQTSPKGNEI
jgi:hypothetical protein